MWGSRDWLSGCRLPARDSQNPHGGSRPFVTPIPKGTRFWPLRALNACGMDTCAGKMPTHIKEKELQKRFKGGR